MDIEQMRKKNKKSIIIAMVCFFICTIILSLLLPKLVRDSYDRYEKGRFIQECVKVSSLEKCAKKYEQIKEVLDND